VSRPVNITLDDAAAALIESVPMTERDQFVTTAIRRSAPVWQDEDLRRLLQEGAIARAERDRQLAEEWVPLEEEACPTPED
jgi:hypothetical protein